MQTGERINWMLRHEHLWNDKEMLLTAIYAAGVYSRKLSNIDFVVTGLIQQCRKIKKTPKTVATVAAPLTNLIVTENNFDELIKKREVIDILVQSKHPVKRMDENSFTYYDYVVFKRRKHGKVPLHIIDEMNVIFGGGENKYIY